ncbi:RHS repeat domain-containing protein [Flavobacterium sp.]|uniref:RHS repeat domain-containing protein n=1 Tax=Flavobacterium sp. TaxID=239 RepID=UPI0039E61DD2
MDNIFDLVFSTKIVQPLHRNNTKPSQRPIRKYYSADKVIEIVKEDNTTKIITYITGDPYNSNYMKIELLTGNALTSLNHYYLHRDSQSSIVAISKADSSGALVEQRYFDAWGNLKNAIVSNVTLTPNSLGWISSLLLDRGYTGHEHLNTVGLIHMNGRLYDPKLKRFLSPDNFVQDAFNTQNYNRYGYVLNNPLLYTDPSGEVFGIGEAIIIGIAVAVISNAVNNVINGVPFWYGTGKAAVIGGASAAISFGIGKAVEGLAIFDKALFQAGMHGISGGLMNVLGGGEFGSGFASGVVSSLISSVIQARVDSKNFATNNPGLFKAIMIASGGLSGGLSSTIAGGKFVDGFRQGVITSGLNHALHGGDGDGGGEEEKKLYEKTGDDYGSDFWERATNPVFWKDFGERLIFGDGDPNIIKAEIDNPFFGGGAKIKGLKWLTQMAKKPNFVSSSVKKVGNFFELSVKNKGSNGSYTIYKKYINYEGKTIKMFHDTYDKTGKFLHREFMIGQERIKIWWNGTREWFSKWR